VQAIATLFTSLGEFAFVGEDMSLEECSVGGITV
jgi:hypothetical protein